MPNVTRWPKRRVRPQSHLCFLLKRHAGNEMRLAYLASEHLTAYLYSVQSTSPRIYLFRSNYGGKETMRSLGQSCRVQGKILFTKYAWQWCPSTAKLANKLTIKLTFQVRHSLKYEKSWSYAWKLSGATRECGFSAHKWLTKFSHQIHR